MRTHYDNLKVPEDASQEVIKKAFRALSKKHHPDQNPGNADSQRIMQILNDAYGVLGNERDRAIYDRSLRERRAAASVSRTNPHESFPQSGQGYPPPYNRTQTARARSSARHAQSYRRPYVPAPKGCFWALAWNRLGQVVVIFVLISMYLNSRSSLSEAGYKPSISAIRTTIVSPFRGWQGNTLVRLSNGQTWRQVDSKAILHNLSQPQVLLYYQNNHWWMRVNGMAQEVRVVRVDTYPSPFLRK